MGLMLLLPNCSVFEKNESSNEIVSLTDTVIKKHEGVDIQIKPIDLPYKK
jgi:hypothetical protein